MTSIDSGHMRGEHCTNRAVEECLSANRENLACCVCLKHPQSCPWSQKAQNVLSVLRPFSRRFLGMAMSSTLSILRLEPDFDGSSKGGIAIATRASGIDCSINLWASAGKE